MPKFNTTTNITLTERKFTPGELKQLNSKKYLSFKCTRKKVVEGNKTDFALFTLSDSIVSEHHTVGITPVYVRETYESMRKNRVTSMGYNGFKVVVSFINKDDSKHFAQIGATTVMFTSQCDVADTLAMAEKFAKAQNNLLWAMPDNAVRVGKEPKGRVKFTV